MAHVARLERLSSGMYQSSARVNFNLFCLPRKTDTFKGKKLLPISFRLFILSFCLITAQANAKNSEKLDVLRRVNAVISELLVVAAGRQSPGRHATAQSPQDNVIVLINRIDSLEVLARLSAASRAFTHPGRAQDHLVDNVFDESWHACIRRIEHVGGPAAIATLQDIALEQRLDGAYSFALEAALKRLTAQRR